jgi:hypothetical protein
MRILMTILKVVAIIFGFSLLIGAMGDFGSNTGSSAYQAGAAIGSVMLLAVGLFLIIIPAVSIYRSFSTSDKSEKEKLN